MTRVLESLLLIVLGVVSSWEAIRLGMEARAEQLFDVVGPDRYLLGISVLLTLLGLAHLRGKRKSSAPPPAAEEPQAAHLPAALTLLMAIYAAAMPFIGYALATALFLVASLSLTRAGSRRSILLVAIVTSIAFVLIFDVFADMPLPTGSIWPTRD